VAVGLTRGVTAAHLARAVLEAMAHQSADVLEAMGRDARAPVRELRVDGGAAANNLLMQAQADLLRVPVVRPRVTETTALGAAYLAGLAVGFWEDERELARLWEAERTFRPGGDRRRLQHERAQWKRAVERARGWGLEPRVEASGRRGARAALL
jgi:glycerol kinase